jgi:hypothetical protein
MKIELPKTIEDCRPEQMSKWLLLSSGELELDDLIKNLDFRVQVVSIFSGETKEKLNQVAYQDINKAFAHCIQMLSMHDVGEPREKIIIDGKAYEFNKDIGSYETGRIIDMKLVEDIYSNPSQVLAILYTEEGLKYNQTDDRNKIINPIDKREKIFKEHFPGDEFVNVFAFFLTTYEDLNTAMSVLQLMKMKETRKTMEKELKAVKAYRTQNGMIGLITSIFSRKS